MVMLSTQDEIVAMDHLVAATVAENLGDVARFVPEDTAGILVGIGRQADGDFTAIHFDEAPEIPALAATVDGGDAGGPQRTAAAQPLGRAGKLRKTAWRGRGRR